MSKAGRTTGADGMTASLAGARKADDRRRSMCHRAGKHGCCCSAFLDQYEKTRYRFAFTRNNYNLQSLTPFPGPSRTTRGLSDHSASLLATVTPISSDLI